MTLLKTITFAALHFTVAFTIAYALTGSLAIGGLIALIEPIANTVAFYWHERAWQVALRRRASRKSGKRIERALAA